MLKYFFLITFYLFLQVHTYGQEANNTQKKSALLLGMYHFDNPNRDTYNMKVDDYLSVKRQNQIQEVADSLENYKPTKIMVEALPSQQATLDSLYELYLQDKITLDDIKNGKNEIYQLGFRLGKKLGGIPIKAIDHNGNWLAPYADFIADTLSLEYYQKDYAEKAAQNKKQQEAFLLNTVRQNLIYLNQWEQILENHTYYNNIAVQVKDTATIMFGYQEQEQEIEGVPYLMRSFDFNNIGVELVTEWYKRNLFIYRNILENTEENEQVLIIFGSGHIRYLQQMLEDNTEFEVVDVNQFLK
ncbi:DUF5694 domain-containing protein [Bernardetia sp. OM2101]|uniref:DUF5694 domain-containing protein n=1 Tax=Bernardetia sp. OM2101 TaxID=3344876 RepID=UPI0035D0035C